VSQGRQSSERYEGGSNPPRTIGQRIRPCARSRLGRRVSTLPPGPPLSDGDEQEATSECQCPPPATRGSSVGGEDHGGEAEHHRCRPSAPRGDPPPSRLKGGEQAAALPTGHCSPTAPSPRATTSCDAKAADKGRCAAQPRSAVPALSADVQKLGVPTTTGQSKGDQEKSDSNRTHDVRNHGYRTGEIACIRPE
jgi:hypothetical protein